MNTAVRIHIEEQNSITTYSLKRNPGDARTLPGAVTCLRILPMPGGVWALVGDVQPHTCPAPLLIDDLRQVILEAERLSSEFPEIPLDAKTLQPKPVLGQRRLDRRKQGGWAVGVVTEPAYFVNADHLYHHLRAHGFRKEGGAYLREGQDERVFLFRSWDSMDDMTAWEIVDHRMDHDGALPPHLEVPVGTCPQCLSRHVAMPVDGSGYYCQECHYAPQD